MNDGTRVDVLGAVSVRRGDLVLAGRELGGRRVRVALVALALADRPLAADRLADVIWAGHPPVTWPDALRGVVRSLRSTLAAIGAGDQQVVATVPAGYQLAAGVQVDLRAAAAAVREAAELARQGRPAAALVLAEPLTGLSGDQLLAGEDASWLAEPRREADAVAFQAVLIVAESAGRTGEHHRATEAARRAVAMAPLDERSHRALIGALDGAGDRAGVVQAFEQCRSQLAEQLGVEPDKETIAAYLTAIGEGGAGPIARLPPATSAFFGRDEELAQLRAAVRSPGLVTVTGSGGVGKSRLAAHVARGAGHFAGGPMWISLAAATKDELVAATAATALGLPPGKDDATALLAGHLAPLGQVLLILDGCEGVLDGAASLAAELLMLCPQLTTVVTSRVPLAVHGEQVVTVPPLPAPAGGDRQALRASVQVQLLADRVRQGGGQLTFDQDTAPLVAELCRRCGGLPLALELVAAQLTAMSVADLLDHLPALLADGEGRLRAVARSSYELLGPDEAVVFRRLSILEGYLTLPFVRQAVSGGTIAPVRVVRILRELASRGLLSVEPSGGRWRYYQDDDLRRFGRELLAAAGEEAAATSQLADAVFAVVPSDPRAAPGPYLDAIGEILPAVRSVLSASIEGRLTRDRGLELSFRLHRYWATTNVAEGRFWLARLLAEAPASPSAAHAIYALGYLGYWSGDADAAVQELSAAAELLTGAPDEYLARALIYLGGLADDLDRGQEAVNYVRRSIDAAASFSVDLQVSAAIGMGCVLAERTQPEAARAALDAIALCRGGGSAEQLAATLPTAAMVCWQVGDLQAARALIAEAMPLLAGTRRIATAVLLSAAAGVAHADGDLDTAIELGTAADEMAAELGIGRELPLIRCVLARSRLELGQGRAAAALAADAIRAAQSLSFAFPLAMCLETAALVLLEHDAGPDGPPPGLLLAAAAGIRRRGDRPGVPSLQARVTAAAGARAGGRPGSPARPDAELAAAAVAALAALAGSAEVTRSPEPGALASPAAGPDRGPAGPGAGPAAGRAGS
jgi:predicted ATPase/DNA-binding SARP family transcriptional activator